MPNEHDTLQNAATAPNAKPLVRARDKDGLGHQEALFKPSHPDAL
jgi:hypothetical protein